MKQVRVQLHITTTTLVGSLVIIVGLISLYVIRDPHFASTCIISGSGLVGAAKICNDFGINRNTNKQEQTGTRTIRTISREEYNKLPLEEILDPNIRWNVT